MKKDYSGHPNSRLRFELSLALVFIALGVASRFWLIDMPNFKPVAAIALFTGFLFRRWFIAIAIPMVVMMISDLGIGTYQWQLALAVYTSLAVAGLLGVLVRKIAKTRKLLRGRIAQVGTFALASLTMSTVFFVSTNGCVWLLGDWYATTWNGLVSCFAAGLPFYRWTLAGDLVFTIAIVATYYAALDIAELARKRIPRRLESAIGAFDIAPSARRIGMNWSQR